MMIDYRKQGKTQITSEILDEAPKDFNGTVATHSENHPFEVNKKRKKLYKNEKEIFHHLVEKSIFLTSHARHNIQTTVVFLCMRVKSPYQDGWNTLGRIL